MKRGWRSEQGTAKVDSTGQRAPTLVWTGLRTLDQKEMQETTHMWPFVKYQAGGFTILLETFGILNYKVIRAKQTKGAKRARKIPAIRTKKSNRK